jgi:hypothetical protein
VTVKRLFSIDNRQSRQALDRDSPFIAPQVLETNSHAGPGDILTELLAPLNQDGGVPTQQIIQPQRC